jgi:hypothetical protein
MHLTPGDIKKIKKGESIAFRAGLSKEGKKESKKLEKEADKKPEDSENKGDLDKIGDVMKGSMAGNALNDSMPTKSNIETIDFFYFGDLIEAAIEIAAAQGRPLEGTKFSDEGGKIRQKTLASSQKIKNGLYKIIICPININDRDINIADIPIPFKTFTAWFVDRVTKRDKDFYSLRDFIRDAVNKLVTSPLSQNCGNVVGGTSPQITTVEMSSDISNPLKDNPRVKKRFKPKGKDAKQYGKDYGYMIIYHAGSPTLKMNLNGNFSEDIGRGIMHFLIGSDRGALKRVKFNKNDIPHRREYAIVEGSDPKDELREIYDINVDLVGNTYFTPGMYVYLRPTIMGSKGKTLEPEISRTLGLGGYYLVTKVNSKVDSSGFGTTLSARWVSAEL